MIVLPWWLSGSESACQCFKHWFNPLVGKPLKKEVAMHSSVLASIPWTEEPGGLEFIRLQKSWACFSH